MNNEPVAWRTHYPSGWEYKDGNPPFELKGNSQLLYTHPVNPKYDPETGEPLIDGYPLFSGLPHPVKDKPHPKCDEACMYLCQMRELTDKEILEICDLGEWHRDEFAIKFARAILRKAQER